MKQLENYVKELEVRQNKTNHLEGPPGDISDRLDENDDKNSVGDFRRDIEDQVKNKLEAEYKTKFEKEKDEIVRRFTEEQLRQQKRISSMEQRLRETIHKEIDDEFKKNLAKKERLLQLNYKKKLDEDRKVLDENHSKEWQEKIEKERKAIEQEKTEICTNINISI